VDDGPDEAPGLAADAASAEPAAEAAPGEPTGVGGEEAVEPLIGSLATTEAGGSEGSEAGPVGNDAAEAAGGGVTMAVAGGEVGVSFEQAPSHSVDATAPTIQDFFIACSAGARAPDARSLSMRLGGGDRRPSTSAVGKDAHAR
jgi:hypothetical protein